MAIWKSLKRAERKAHEILGQLERGQGQRNDLTLSNDGQSSQYAKVLVDTNTTRQDASRWQAELRQQGWSLRRIAERVGVSQEQARRDVSGVTFVTPPTVTGADKARWPETRAEIRQKAGLKQYRNEIISSREEIAPTFTADTAAKTAAYLTCGWRVIHRRR